MVSLPQPKCFSVLRGLWGRADRAERVGKQPCTAVVLADGPGGKPGTQNPLNKP